MKPPRIDIVPLAVFTLTLGVIFVYGCVQIKGPPVRKFPPALQSLRQKALQGSGMVRKSLLPPPRKETVTLVIENGKGFAWNWTVLEASTNCSDWTMASVLPFQSGANVVVLSNRPPWEFYRAANRM